MIKLVLILILISCSKIDPIIVAGDPQPESPPLWAFFTVEGVDADKDGVRDDVEIWINEQTHDYNYNQALKQIARTDLESMKIIDSLNAQLNLQSSVKNGLCKKFILMHTYPEELRKNPSVTYLLLKKILNNPWRKNRYNSVGELIPRQYLLVTAKYPIEEFTSCDFQVRDFKNLLLKHKKKYEKKTSTVEAIDAYIQENNL